MTKTLPTLTTARLRLRPWRLDDDADVKAFHKIQGDPRVIWWGHAVDVDASRAVMLKRSEVDAPPLGTWAIERDSDVVGVGLAFRSDVGTEIGWHVRRDVQGQGIAGEAAGALLAHAFAQGVVDVVAAIVPVNVPSQKVAQRLGFVVDGSCIKAGLFHELWRPRR